MRPLRMLRFGPGQPPGVEARPRKRNTPATGRRVSSGGANAGRRAASARPRLDRRAACYFVTTSLPFIMLEWPGKEQ